MPKIQSLFFVLLVTSSRLALALADTSSTTAPSPTTDDPVSTVEPCVRYHKTGFWDIDILNWELDPKICGPPLSVNATTDKSRLPIEICAVVGAYLVLVCGLGTLLLTVGKRARKIAQGYVPPLAVEMMQHSKTGFEPMSPNSTKTWFKKSVGSFKSLGGAQSARNSNVSDFARSPVAESINSFDARVLQDDRESRAIEMERLYAAVMAHDEAKDSQISVSQVEVPNDTPPRYASPRQKPTRLNLSVASTLTPDAHVANPEAGLPLSPRTPRAIYPPGHRFPNAQSNNIGHINHLAAEPPSFASLASPTFVRVELPNDMYPASPPPADRPAMTLPLPRPPPPPSDTGLPLSPRLAFRRGSQGAASTGSGSSRSRKTPNIKNLRIGGPIGADDDDREPLSPHVNQNEAAAPHGVRFALQSDPPHTAKSYETDATAETNYNYESLDCPTPLPVSPRHPPPSGLTLQLPPSATTSPNPGHASLRSTQSASSSSNALPLRAYFNTALTSPAATKTTFLERRDNRIGRGPLTARTPRTGAIPQTPYSAYMPFTPITPITPRLVSRKERKERAKAEGKKVIIEEDAVADEEEMWE